MVAPQKEVPLCPAIDNPQKNSMQGNCHREHPVTNLLALNKRVQGNARILANSGEEYHVVPYICLILLERLTPYTAMGYRTNLPSSLTCSLITDYQSLD